MVNDFKNLKPIMKNQYAKKVKILPYDPKQSEKERDKLDEIFKPKTREEKQSKFKKLRKIIDDALSGGKSE